MSTWPIRSRSEADPKPIRSRSEADSKGRSEGVRFLRVKFQSSCGWHLTASNLTPLQAPFSLKSFGILGSMGRYRRLRHSAQQRHIAMKIRIGALEIEV